MSLDRLDQIGSGTDTSGFTIALGLLSSTDGENQAFYSGYSHIVFKVDIIKDDQGEAARAMDGRREGGWIRGRGVK